MTIRCKCPTCRESSPRDHNGKVIHVGRDFISEKAIIKHLRKEQRELLRRNAGIRQAEKSERIGMAAISSKRKGYEPLHQSNSKEQRVKPDLIHVKRFTITK